MQPGRKLLCLFVICSFSSMYASVPAQDRGAQQSRPAPGGQQGGRGPGGGQSGRPNTGGGSKPGRPNPGGSNGQPGRPNPGGGNQGKPPSRPNPGGGGNNRPQPGRPGSGQRPPNRPGSGRPPQWGRPPANRPSYNFRPNDRSYLHRYYGRSLAGINRARRPRFVIGGYFPYADIGYITPVPPHVYGYLPPPPPGYQMGYYDGYVVVYDPLTYFMLNVVDLLQ